MARDTSSNITRGPAVSLTINNKSIQAFAGETLATAILASDHLHFNLTGGKQARGAFCNMGTCFECQVRVARTPGQPYRWVRACMVKAENGQSVLIGQSRQVVSGNEHDH